AVTRGAGELANLCDLSLALLRSAQVRTETRGAHARREYPSALSQWQVRLLHARSGLSSSTAAGHHR
ncbi:MAG: hypothetical protein ACRDV4_05050, partial [Acidimicrobiales bacterium]